MDQELKEELFKLRSEIVKMRNDIIYVQHSVSKIEKQLVKLNEASNKPAELKDNDISTLFGPGTKIEKL
jgi:predicted translin family RNA/ssDNA-binding protein